MSQFWTEWWPFASMLLGAMSAYYGARNVIEKRLATLEAKHEANATNVASDIQELRVRVHDAHEKIYRIMENRAPGATR